MGELFTPTHLMVLGVVAFVVFGGRKLPELGRGLGDGMRGFADGLKGMKRELRESTETNTVSKAETDTGRQGA
jgi:sec-independent protein translocase protein TatA